ncbi:MAG: SsrA-binding protein SmpB [Kiritimatiellae bacterium]|nr:SsrA-binding protein SmpB [Kiritimatiellia bacterium]
MPTSNPRKRLVSNRRALHDYTVIEHLEAGLELRGTEVKSLRDGNGSLVGAYCGIEKGEAFLFGMDIPPYDCGNRFNHDPKRKRRLLLHRREIDRLTGQTEQKGLALIPLSLYIKRGHMKLDVGVCRGKRQADKRETLRQRTSEREAQREMSRYR